MYFKKNATILVIDDEEDLVEIIKCQLESRGYDIVTAGDGAAALRKLQDLDPALIILDLSMPRMGGLEFYNKIMLDGSRTKYPVLVLTGRVDLEDVFKDTRVEGFLSKPFEIMNLISEVERIAPGRIDPVIFLLDFPGNRHVDKIIDTLRKNRFNVLNFENLTDAREAAEKIPPEYIIMEYIQKEKSGETMIREMRGDEHLKNAKIAVYSYSGFQYYEEKSLNAGADVYMGKPPDYDMFVSTLKYLSQNKPVPGP